jgi:Lrp/AsnC family leucine-responsive transcriptional regulator
MEESGVIRGYRADVNPAKLGYPVAAFVGLRVPREHFHQVITLARDIAEVRECHHASGDFDFLLKIIAASGEALDGIVARFRSFGQIQASVILSTPVEKYSA